jgi:hypothetical protein
MKSDEHIREKGGRKGGLWEKQGIPVQSTLALFDNSFCDLGDRSGGKRGWGLKH